MWKVLDQEKGFTLLEAVITLAIIAISSIFMWSAFAVGSRLNAQSEDRTVAANLAQQKMEEIMNTRFRYITESHPPGETAFESMPQSPPYWVLDPEGEWRTVLPEGKYTIGYPDGVDADPLRIRVAISWKGPIYANSSLELETLISMTPGRFRG